MKLLTFSKISLVSLIFMLFFAAGTVSAADVLDPACQEPDSTLCQNKGSGNPLSGSDGIVNKAANLLSIVVGIAAVIAIIIGGAKYVLSAGDPGKIDSAKNTILYALIGLVVAAAAQLIIRFVVSNV